MTIRHRKRIVIGIILIAVGIAIAAAIATTTTTVSDVSLARGAQPDDVGRAFRMEVEEQLVDLRLALVFGVVGVGLIISGFVHRRR